MTAGTRKQPGGRWLAGRPIRTKLALLLVPPVAALLALSTLFGYASWVAATSAEQARRVVALGSVGADLAAQLQLERAAAGLGFVRRSSAVTLEAYRQQSARTDVVLQKFTAARSRLTVPAGLAAPLDRLDDQLRELPLLREQVRAGNDVTATTVAFRYRSIIADLLVFRSGLAQLAVDADTATGLRACASLSQAIEGLGLLQMAVLPWLGAEALPPAAQQQIVAAQAAHTEAVETFRLLAPQWQASLTAGPVSPDAAADERLMALAVSAAPNTSLDLGTDPAGWVAALNARMTQLHTAEAELDRYLLAAVTRQRDAQRREITQLGCAVGFSLLLLAAAGWWVTRSMTRTLRVLADGATEMAVSTLPTVVDRLVIEAADPEAMEEVIQQAGRPLPVVGHDEISYVSTAFNSVAAQAVRLAGDQARSRAATALVADTLGRRLQHVVDRVTARLDELISTEENPAQLHLLYSIDERVQPGRMLINNLRVLAGGRAGLPAKDAVPLPDVVVAATGQVPGAYHRVSSDEVSDDVLIDAAAVEELVHLLAVLIDNALRACPSPQPVQVYGKRINDRALLQVSDTGVGIADIQLTELQHRLVDDTSNLDVDAARHMGLAVAGRIARRLGITMTLRSHVGAGTQVDIELPETLFRVDAYGGRPDPATVTSQHAPGPAILPALLQVGAAGPAVSHALPAAPAATDSATVLLPVVTAGGPPPWPPQAADPPLQIFDQVSVQHPWFTAAGTKGRTVPTVPDDWRQATAAAEWVSGELEAHAATINGLPKRHPGRFAVRAPQTQTVVPRQRDHAAAARGLSSLSVNVRSGRPVPSRSNR